MNELTKIYKDHNVRIIEKDGQPWFVAKDVAEILGYSDTQAMTRKLAKDEKGTCTDNSSGQVRNITVLNEYGLFAAILKSNKKEAIDFQRWVTHEVLPSIRRTGSYTIPDGKKWYESASRLTISDLPALLEEKRRLEQGKHELEALNAKINRIQLEDAVKRLTWYDVQALLIHIGREYPYAIRKEEPHEQLPELPE